MVQLTEDEVDDLIYFARAGEAADLAEALAGLVSRAGDGDGATALSVLAAAVDEGKNTPLHMAAGNGHEEVVRFVLGQIEAGPKPARQALLDAANAYGNTAVHWAAMNGHLAVVKLLVEEGGASPALANDKNYVALDLAGLNDKVDVVDYFLASAEKAEAEAEGGSAGKEGAAASASGKAAASSAAGGADGLSSAAAGIDLNEGDADEEEEEEEVVFSATRG